VPSQLLRNEKISFVACRNFTHAGVEYHIGDEFPGEAANNIETLVRARYVFAVVEDLSDKPRHWHGHVRPRAEIEEKLRRLIEGNVQLVMPETEGVDLELLTDPNRPEPETEEAEAEAPAEPGEQVPDGTISEVLAWVGEDQDRARAAIAAEQEGRVRSTLINKLEQVLEE
jgi:hypothetical protein